MNMTGHVNDNHSPGTRVFRAITYIDGYNLYFGMRDRGWKRYYWLDVARLSQSLLRTDQTLVHTKYFTSRIADPEAQRKRQAAYLDALGTISDLSIMYGQYLKSMRECRECGYRYQVSSEKMTDVNIATELLSDAFTDQFDTAVVISADSDLVPPIAKVRKLFPQKRVIVAFPPNRQSVELRRAAHVTLFIESSHLSKSQLPDEITKPDGYVLRRPDKWK